MHLQARRGELRRSRRLGEENRDVLLQAWRERAPLPPALQPAGTCPRATPLRSAGGTDPVVATPMRTFASLVGGADPVVATPKRTFASLVRGPTP